MATAKRRSHPIALRRALTSENHFRQAVETVTALVLAGGLTVIAGALAESSRWVVAGVIAVVAVMVTRFTFRFTRPKPPAPEYPVGLDPRVNPPLDNRRLLGGSWALMLGAGAAMFGAGYLGPESGWALVAPFALGASPLIAASRHVDHLASERPPLRAGDGSLRMHIVKADRRRRFGETSWERYGDEAAEAVGVVRKCLGVLSFRREFDFRLGKLDGVWLGDLRAVWPLEILEAMESLLWNWRNGVLTSADVAKLMRFEIQRGARHASDPASPLDSRERNEKATKAMEARLKRYEKEDIGPILNSYPLLDSWLYRVQRGRGGQLRNRVFEDALEELSEAGFETVARRGGGIVDVLTPDL